MSKLLYQTKHYCRRAPTCSHEPGFWPVRGVSDSWWVWVTADGCEWQLMDVCDRWGVCVWQLMGVCDIWWVWVTVEGCERQLRGVSDSWRVCVLGEGSGESVRHADRQSDGCEWQLRGESDSWGVCVCVCVCVWQVRGLEGQCGVLTDRVRGVSDSWGVWVTADMCVWQVKGLEGQCGVLTDRVSGLDQATATLRRQLEQADSDRSTAVSTAPALSNVHSLQAWCPRYLDFFYSSFCYCVQMDILKIAVNWWLLAMTLLKPIVCSRTTWAQQWSLKASSLLYNSCNEAQKSKLLSYPIVVVVSATNESFSQIHYYQSYCTVEISSNSCVSIVLAGELHPIFYQESLTPLFAFRKTVQCTQR